VDVRRSMQVFDVWRSLLNVLNELRLASSQFAAVFNVQSDGDPGA